MCFYSNFLWWVLKSWIFQSFLFLFSLLGWHWLTTLHTFQVRNSTTHHQCSVLSGQHPKSSLFLSPFISPKPSSTFLHPSPPGNLNCCPCPSTFIFQHMHSRVYLPLMHSFDCVLTIFMFLKIHFICFYYYWAQTTSNTSVVKSLAMVS